MSRFSRECASDFERMKSYVAEYSISDNAKSASYVIALKSIHKCYFSFLVWVAEMEFNDTKLKSIYADCTDEIISRLSEVSSDLGASIFNWMNGGYKTSRVMLRVSIENFIRAMSAIEDKTQLTEKNVYNLFSKAESLNIFDTSKHPEISAAFNALHGDYKLLCADVHTATGNNMANLSSLADFPDYDELKAKDCAKVLIRVVSNMLVVKTFVLNDFFHGFHHKNKESVMQSIPRGLKPLVLAPNR